MWALVTGASSGIGRDMSRYLSELGYNLILVSRNKEELDNLKQELENKSSIQIQVIVEDLSNKKIVLIYMKKLRIQI